MRHGHGFRKLNRTKSHREAMFRNMVTSLIEHEQIRTTDAKAKEIRKVAERMISLAKDGSLHARRQALSYIRSKQVVAKLFDELSSRYAQRPGGAIRVVKIGYRNGDGAAMSIVELVSEEVKKPRRRRRRKKEAPAAEAKPAEETKAEEAAAEAPAEEPEAEEVKAEAPTEEAPAEEAKAEEPVEEEKKD